MKNHTRQSLISQLSALKIDTCGTLMVHSSFKSIGPVDGGPDTVIDALTDYMKNGLLLFPTHSWSENNLPDNTYNPLVEPSCVGLLSNLFLKREGVCRSLHPSHSVAGLGHDARDFVKGESRSNTPCPRTGCWGRLYDRSAEILFIGCSLNTNTFLHSVEEWSSIPNRLAVEPRMIKVLPPDGEPYTLAFHGHYSTYGDVSHNYGKLLPLFLEKKIARQGSFGDAAVVVCRAREMGDYVTELLKWDPDFFADGRLS
jgi:aminoglycoside 3-N-acetyltransferase